MRRSWTFALFQLEQPSPEVWEEVERFAEAHQPPFEPVMGFMWQATIHDEADLEPLREAVEELERTHGAVVRTSWRDTLEDADYDEADFVGVLGAELSTEPPFILNADEVLVPRGPCPRCGAEDAFDVEQTGPFVLDETRLDEPDADDRAPGAEGWDMIVTPNGHNLVSARLQARLADEGIRGYSLMEVIDAATGEPSERMAQLLADTVILTPCSEHSTVEGGEFCPRCGAAHGTLEGHFYARSDELGDADVLSRHPSRGAMLYLSRRAFEALADGSGVERNGVLMVCKH